MYPEYLFEYPNRNADFPFYLKRKLQWKTPSHRHDFVELTLVVSGKGKETINGESHDMVPGTMVLLLPYQVHEVVSDPNDPLDLFICNFSIDSITELGKLDMGLHDLVLGSHVNIRKTFAHLDANAFEEMKICFASMLGEFEKPLPFKSVMLKTQLQRALTEFARSGLQAQSYTAATEEALTAAAGSNAKPAPIWSIINYVHEHYLEPLTLSGLSEQFHIHPSSLSEMFTHQYGVHFTDLIHELRVRHACSLLHATDMDITQVAEESGFGSYSSFVRIFQKSKGIPPRSYRSAQASNKR